MMKLKKSLSFIFCLILFLVSYKTYVSYTKIENVDFENPKKLLNLDPLYGKKILLINTQAKFGGGEIYTINLYKNLINSGINAKILVKKNSWLEQELIKEKLSYFACKTFKFGFCKNLEKICKDHCFELIHCNVDHECIAAKSVASNLPVCVVFTKHIPNSFPQKITKGLDGIIAVSSQIAEEMRLKNINEHLQIQEIEVIPPFFDEENFRNFKTFEIKNEFFHKNFGIILKNLPLICNITNMSRDKNPHLLVKAVSILVHKKNKPIEVIFVGSGRQLERVRTLAKDLNVYEYTHFLGYSRKIPGILYFSDILVNTSKKEGFGIVLLEGATMNKVLVGPKDTGVADVIINNETGLLFENDNEYDLANALERLIDDKQLFNNLSRASAMHIQKNFSTQATIEKIQNFYKKIIFSKKHSQSKIL